MTNNPTIDGVQRAEPEVVGWAHPRDLQSDGYSHSFTVRSEQPGTPYQDGNFPVALIQAEDHYAEVTALQSTIAQLQARIAELESGRGEIIHQIRTHGSDCWEDISGESLELCQCDPEEYEIRKLFTAPPVPVAPEKYDDVLLPFLSLMRAELHANAHKGDRPGWLQMDSKTAILEGFYHMGKLHQAVHRNETAAIKEYAADVANMCMMLLDVCACLDATAALSEPDK